MAKYIISIILNLLIIGKDFITILVFAFLIGNPFQHTNLIKIIIVFIVSVIISNIINRLAILLESKVNIDEED